MLAALISRNAEIRRHYGNALEGKLLSVWGLALKPRTDDVREAPALTLIIDEMLQEGVHLRVHDPEALANVKAIYGDKITYCDRPYSALEGADGLAIVTEWFGFRHPDFEVMRRLMRAPVISMAATSAIPRRSRTSASPITPSAGRRNERITATPRSHALRGTHCFAAPRRRGHAMFWQGGFYSLRGIQSATHERLEAVTFCENDEDLAKNEN